MASHTKSNPEWHVDIIWYKSRLCSVDTCLLNVIIAMAWLYNLFAFDFITSPHSLCSQSPKNIRIPSNFHFKLGNNSTVSRGFNTWYQQTGNKDIVSLSRCSADILRQHHSVHSFNLMNTQKGVCLDVPRRMHICSEYGVSKRAYSNTCVVTNALSVNKNVTSVSTSYYSTLLLIL